MGDADELSLGKDDRLPWLEPVEPEPEETPIDKAKIIGLLVALIAAIAIAVGGIWWLRSQDNVPKGDGSLIEAPTDPYKVPPSETGGMKVEGQGDAAFAASEGADANGQLDIAAQPEAPVDGQRVADVKPKPPVAAGQKASAPVAVGGKLATPKPVVPAPRPATPSPTAAPGTGLIQLGAYTSEAAANQAYNALAQRYAFLGTMPRMIVQANVGGTSFYRLRVTAGAQAAETCAKLKAGGANCLIVK